MPTADYKTLGLPQVETPPKHPTCLQDIRPAPPTTPVPSRHDIAPVPQSRRAPQRPQQPQLLPAHHSNRPVSLQRRTVRAGRTVGKWSRTAGVETAPLIRIPIASANGNITVPAPHLHTIV
ncbi:hypothetical protein BU26DRAFT_145940 [Trematosphaeria pertusa]|uniref:Uncharacterized protein n=1 Tax=Trematosphaeria pertusa TaxID=390896 RepID=A0A6A6IW94_9PLEO|nr:uncharacterized protein BU26DRAFT_145940 [Trematosphaeria pertusa]KAF2254821.1 hypothetical protein BU26DRAFT_145940 [Trematosphaeria pertusa]